MPASPPVIPGYTVGTELGHDGAAAAWSATHDATGDAVALTVFDATGDDADALLAEAALVASVDHPGVVRVREFGTAGGAAWIATDLVPGRDLDRYVQENGTLPPAEAALLVADAADGVAALHAAGLVHGDVRPASLLLDEEDGVAVAVRISTAAHLAAGRNAAATPGDDVYGLGGVLSTALTGSGAVADLPDDYGHVLATALAEDPADRFPTATALADELRVLAAGDEFGPPPPAPARRPARTAVLAVAVAVVVVAAVALALWRPWSGGGGATGSPPSHGAGGPLRRLVCTRDAEDLELRDEPGGSQVGLLTFGDTVTVRRRDPSGGWAYVSTRDGYGGWVLGSVLRPSCPAAR
ncbi:MAG: protein kinase domain-containing protein [Mycobacteriales bacterium]